MSARLMGMAFKTGIPKGAAFCFGKVVRLRQRRGLVLSVARNAGGRYGLRRNRRTAAYQVAEG